MSSTMSLPSLKKKADMTLKIGMIGITNDENDGRVYEIIRINSPRSVAVREVHIGFSKEKKKVVYVSDLNAGVFHVNFHASQTMKGWWAGVTKFNFHTIERE